MEAGGDEGEGGWSPAAEVRLAEAVAGLERAVCGIAAVQEVHGRMLERLLVAAEQEPGAEGERLHDALEAMAGQQSRQNQLLAQMVAALDRLGARVGAAPGGLPIADPGHVGGPPSGGGPRRPGSG